jgi:pyruvate ferredoxin oxidoreductase beta subunit
VTTAEDIMTAQQPVTLPDFHRGNRLLAEDDRNVQANMRRTNSLNSGHRACQGCGEALGARYAIDAAMQATNNQVMAVNATGCLEVFSTPYPETSWQIPWLHSLFGNTAAVASGVAAGLRARGKKDVRVIAQGGHRLRLPVGHVRAQR